jgi:hypothetical protein
MKKIFVLYLLVILVGGCANSRTVLITEGNLVADIISRNRPGGCIESTPIYAILNHYFYWGEAKDSIQKKMPVAMTLKDKTEKNYFYETFIGMHGEERTIGIFVDHTFDSHKRLHSIRYCITIQSVNESDTIDTEIATAYSKILTMTYGNNYTYEEINLNADEKVTMVRWRTKNNSQVLASMWHTQNNKKEKSIIVRLDDPTY